MKGRALILIFLFLVVLIFSIPSVCADTKYDYFNFSGSTQTEYDTPNQGSATQTYFDSIYFPQISNMKDFKHLQLELPADEFTGTKDSEYDTSVTFTIDGNTVGTGIFGYHRTMDDSTIYVHVFTWPGTWDVEGLNGAKRMMITTNSVDVRHSKSGWSYQQTTAPTGATQAHLMYSNGYVISDTDSDSFDYSLYLEYEQSYPFEYTNEAVFNSLNVFRSSVLKAKCNIEIGGVEVLDDTAYQSIPLDWTSIDIENNTWVVSLTNEYSDTITKTLTFGELENDGIINFNQSNYVDPENIEVDWDITKFYTTSYNYLIQVTATVDGDVSGNFWEASGNWNVTPYISSASGAAVFDFYSDGYDLPVWIQGELWAQDKSTGTWTKLDSTPAVVYHEAALEPGKIWMDQAVYDTGDIATVSYETASDSAYVIVRKYPKAVWSQGEYYIWNVPAGSGTRTFVIPPSGTGDWKAELSESDITVNETMFSVNETTTPFLAWDDIDGIIGESQILHFYSNDVNATLQIYDADQTVIYDETVGDGYFQDYAISTQTNHAPGTWTASLNCSGSYYNDTLIMYAKDAYVAFNADSYTLGQTISIQYYLKRSTQTIVLYDANKKDVITWTTAGNYIHHGIGTGSVDFTLSDNNEYGLDIVAGVDANDIKLGLWKVEVLDRGQPIADNPVYDSAKVSSVIDDPADASNEMIKIFFSPEGLFMIFTAALTMMGLVAAKHPAGGGAGATIGVGFGVHFNVLPPWLLLLTVILLVVLAGVSAAVYFKGK